jgi:hypothetical protein
MSTKHTPGPWRYLPGDGLEWRTSVQRGTEGGFVVRGTSREREEADARLIAAAPELLEALKEITSDYADRFDLDDPSTNPGIKSSIKQARAAIAKATGASNG